MNMLTKLVMGAMGALRPQPALGQALDVLSTLLWAADGVNRSDGGRTAPSAMGAKEVQVYVALPRWVTRRADEEAASSPRG